MVSEIKGPGAQSVATVDTGLRKAGGTAQSAGASSIPESEVVTLTDLAARLQRLTEAVDRLPVVDQARVAEFKQAIDNGDYRIDDRQIADKLMAFEALLTRDAHASRA
jgi:negative regulator of flagellin synthesis FlgM